MSGPYPPHQGAGVDPAYAGPWSPGSGQQPSPGHQPFPPMVGPQGPPQGGPYPSAYPGATYPGPLPPPVQYPRPRRWRVVILALAVVAVVAAAAIAIVFAVRDSTPPATITAASTQRAIQTYLDALSNGDTEVIARNTLCGLYDGVHDRRSDDALAKLSSDAFQKQFSKVTVTSVDTMVFASPSAAQVLFSMKVSPASGSKVASDQQGVAQVLAFNGELLVCSYVLRTSGMY